MDSKVCFFILIVGTGFANPLIATNKLSLATWGSYYQQDHMGPGTYAFGYDIEDPVTGNIQFKQEERHPNGTVTGSYGYVDAEGRPNVVTYIADEKGYRAKLEIEGRPPEHFPDESTSSLGSLLRQYANADDGSAPDDHHPGTHGNRPLISYPLLLRIHPLGLNYPSHLRGNYVSK